MSMTRQLWAAILVSMLLALAGSLGFFAWSLASWGAGK